MHGYRRPRCPKVQQGAKRSKDENQSAGTRPAMGTIELRRRRTMKRIRVLGLALTAACAMCVVAAASAHAAARFVAAKYPVEQKAVNTNPQGFEIAGSTSVCKKATFNTNEEGAPNPTGPSDLLEVHPTYSECEVALAGTFKAKTTTTGCNYVFHAANPETKNGTTDVVCTGANKIRVVVEGIPGCEILVPP